MGCTSSQMLVEKALSVRRLPTFDIKALVPMRVGSPTAGPYRLSQALAEGSFGAAVPAEDLEVKGRRVAVKRLRADSSGEERWARLEMWVMGELDHPNICKLLETYEEGPSILLVMEYCGGGTLESSIEERGAIQEAPAANILAQVASALRHAHGRGIAHRDLRPGTIAFCGCEPGDSRVKVVDWGSACSFRNGRMKSRVGSDAYAAREVLEVSAECQDQGYTAACDLWSLGATLHAMLSGREVDRCADKSPLIGAHWEGVSREAKELLRGLLRSAPERRLPLERVLAHPWLLPQHQVGLDSAVARRVLSGLRGCCAGSPGASGALLPVAAAAAATQLDHQELQELDLVFRGLDADGDGQLALQELRAGFELAFGNELQDLSPGELDALAAEVFVSCDLDGSGAVDYTEFCAAGLRQRIAEEPGAAQLAFRALHRGAGGQGTGLLTKDGLKQALRRASTGSRPTADPAGGRRLGELVDEVFAEFDGDGDGALDLAEWQDFLRGKRPEQSVN